MNEKLMQDLLKSFPSELIEEGLEYLSREIVTGNRRLDLVFKDKKDRLVLVETQLGSLDTKHIDRHIDFVEGFLENNPNIDIRLIYIANKIDHLRKSFLERRGYEYLEIPNNKFIAIAREHSLLEETNTVNKDSHKDEEAVDYEPIREDGIKREQFIRSAKTLKEKEFWKLFFQEIDKRRFVKATFQADEFGVHIHSKFHFKSVGGKYSLMFTRKGCFKMNDVGFQDGLSRIKNWCTTPGLAEAFYSQLKSRKLLIGQKLINIPDLVFASSPQHVIQNLFECIDIFR
jgi:hypothetical protein